MVSTAVDIVLATNRLSPFMAQTLESVSQQTFKNWRLIVVDDGAPDEGALRRAVSALPNSTVVRRGPRGLPASRNLGIASGGAPLIALLDDDDLWAPEKLEAQVEALARAPQAVAAFTAGRYIDAEGREFGSGWGAQTVPSQLFVCGEVPPPRIVTLMVRRSAHEAIGRFNETFSMAEDNEYILRMAVHGEMVGVPAPLVSYRRHSANMSSADSIEGRAANRRLLVERLQAHRGDGTDVEKLLSEHLRRFEASAAAECVRATAHALRHRDLLRVVGELRWAATAPALTVRALANAVLRR